MKKRKNKLGIRIKSDEEIEVMRESSRIVGVVLGEIGNYIKPGVSTHEVDQLAEGIILRERGTPKFKGYDGFPAVLCTSLNDEVVHGIPKKNTLLAEGDIFSVDVGVEVEGYCGDGAKTFPVGDVSECAARLLEVTEKSLYLGIESAVENNRVSDISRAIQTYVEDNGYSVIRAFVGHGIGRHLHEEPQVPNYVIAGQRDKRLVSGMVLAIEPMVNAGSYEVVFDDDCWTARTRDGSLSAHFEHTVAITKGGPRILTLE